MRLGHRQGWRSKNRQLDIRPRAAKAQPKTGGRKAGTPNKIQSALSIIRAEVFAEAVRTGRTALWQFPAINAAQVPPLNFAIIVGTLIRAMNGVDHERLAAAWSCFVGALVCGVRWLAVDQQRARVPRLLWL